MKPIRVGITCDHETITDRRGAPSPRYLLGQSYVDAVVAAGAQPWLLPHLAPDAASGMLDGLDALVISGGDFDVPPELYGDTPRPVLGKLNHVRTGFELALLRGALERNMPVLGVCGGMQLLNVVLGGTLHQDLSERPGTGVHSQPQDKRLPHHDITFTAGSRCAAIFGAVAGCNSTHHQIIDRVAPSLVASGVAPDGVIEAIEQPGPGFVVGVQWHPEAMGTQEQLAVYRALVTNAP